MARAQGKKSERIIGGSFRKFKASTVQVAAPENLNNSRILERLVLNTLMNSYHDVQQLSCCYK